MRSIPYGRQSITDDDKAAVLKVLESDFLTQGPAVSEFEHIMADYLGVSESASGVGAVAVSNGTAALHLAALAMKVQPGHRVIVTPNTFAASANCIRYCGGDVEFVDINPATLCLDLDRLEEKLRHKGPGYYHGVVTVDFAGYPSDVERLRKLADTYDFWIIEDAAHALGAEFRTRDGQSRGQWLKAGSGAFVDAATFSFHPVKHIATGEGGLVTSRHPHVVHDVRLLRTHGITKNPRELERNDGAWYYEMQELGYNYRMPDLLCALGISQMKRVNANLQRRREIAGRYSRELAELPLTLPKVDTENVRHAYHLYVVRCEARDQLFAYLHEHGVKCQVHYIPVYDLPYYRKLYGSQELPEMAKYYRTALSIPMYHGLTDDDQTYVIDTIRGFFR